MNRKITLIIALAGMSTAFSQTLNFVNKADKPIARGASASAKNETNDQVYFVNGFSANNPNTSDIEKYDFNSNTWSIVTPSVPTIGKRYGNMEILTNSMFIFNGTTATGLNNKLELINLNTNALTVSTIENPNPTFDGGSSIWGDRVITFGGCSSQFNAVYSKKVYMVNYWSDWQELADMPVGLQAKGEVIYGNGDNSKLYVFGGYREINSVAENFESVTSGANIALTDWLNIAEAGTRPYRGFSFGGNKYAQITAFDGNNNEPSCISWLISKPLTATGTDPVYLNFETKDGYDNGATLQAYLITNWTGDIATSTKTPLNATIAGGTTTGYAVNFTNSGDVQLIGNLANFRIGFKYVGGYVPTTKTTTFQIDNVRVFQPLVSNNIYIYDFASNSWSTSNTVLPQSISAYAVAKDDIANDKIYITGDYNNQTFAGVYNTSNDTFTSLSQTNMIGRRHHNAEFWNNKLYIFGGNTTAFTSSSLASTQMTEAPNLALEGFSTAKLNAYPNPVNDVLTISFDAGISDVSIYNILGQQVMQKSVNGNEAVLDVSDLARGPYVVKVASNGSTQAIKIIKE